MRPRSLGIVLLVVAFEACAGPAHLESGVKRDGVIYEISTWHDLVAKAQRLAKSRLWSQVRDQLAIAKEYAPDCIYETSLLELAFRSCYGDATQERDAACAVASAPMPQYCAVKPRARATAAEP